TAKVSRSDKPVSHASHVDHPAFARALRELTSQPACVSVYRSRGPGEVISPDGAEKVGGGEHPLGLAGEAPQQIELETTKRHGSSGESDQARVGVDSQGPHGGPPSFPGPGLRSSQDRGEARPKLQIAGGRSQKVVCATLERADDVRLARSRPEDDHGHRGGPRGVRAACPTYLLEQ